MLSVCRIENGNRIAVGNPNSFAFEQLKRVRAANEFLIRRAETADGTALTLPELFRNYAVLLLASSSRLWLCACL